jgi:hypothetical protein
MYHSLIVNKRRRAFKNIHVLSIEISLLSKYLYIIESNNNYSNSSSETVGI